VYDRQAEVGKLRSNFQKAAFPLKQNNTPLHQQQQQHQHNSNNNARAPPIQYSLLQTPSAQGGMMVSGGKKNTKPIFIFPFKCLKKEGRNLFSVFYSYD
jgi:hypothetical protein